MSEELYKELAEASGIRNKRRHGRGDRERV